MGGGSNRDVIDRRTDEAMAADTASNVRIEARNQAIRKAKTLDALTTRRDSTGKVLKSTFAKEGKLNSIRLLSKFDEEGGGSAAQFFTKVREGGEFTEGQRVGTGDIITVEKGSTETSQVEAPKKKKAVRKTKGAKKLTKETKKKRQTARKKNTSKTSNSSHVQLKSKGAE